MPKGWGAWLFEAHGDERLLTASNSPGHRWYNMFPRNKIKASLRAALNMPSLAGPKPFRVSHPSILYRHSETHRNTDTQRHTALTGSRGD